MSVRRWAPTINPVFIREMRGRFRGARAFVLLTLFLVLMTIVTAIPYASEYESHANGWSGPAMGRDVFRTLTMAQGILLGLCAPALTFGLLSGERDRGTWELLLATPLSGWRIVAGKMAAVVAYGLLLVAAVMPMIGLTFVLGGVAPRDVLMSQIAILSGAGMLAAVGIAASSMMRTTGRAAVLATAAGALLVVGPWLVFLILGFFTYRAGGAVVSSEAEATIASIFQLSPFSFLIGSIGVLHSSTTPWIWYGQQILLQTIVTGWLLLLASARVRGAMPRRGGTVSIAVLVALMFAWAIWRAAETVNPW